MVSRLLLREERYGGYRFDRKSGKVDFLEGALFSDEINTLRGQSVEYDLISLPTGASSIALSAPLAVWHETTNACNLNCTSCGRARAHEKELEIGDISKIYADFARSGVFEVRVTGGEACLRKDVGEIVGVAKENNLQVSLTSNGVYSNGLRQKVVSLPVDLYILSLDGTKEVHDSIRGRGTYDSTMRSVRALVSAGKNVRVNTVLSQQNKGSIEGLVDVLANAGVKAVTLIPLRPVGIATADFYKNKLTPRQYMGMVQKVGELRKRYDMSIATNYDIITTTSQGSNVPSHWSKMCIAGIEAACISPSGNLRACILAAGEGFNVGNLTQKSLYELWHDDSVWGIFRDTDRRVLEQCRKCPDYTKRCPGSCIAMTEFSKSPDEMYCFRDLV